MPRTPGLIVTRFAPSPTGYLHVGGARTALFNWAYARRHGGTFILRMEDTDVARSTDESTRRIIEDLNWLGLEWDEGPNPKAACGLASSASAASALSNPKENQLGDHGPYFQSQRGELYREYLEKLRKAGRVYDDASGGGAVRFKMPDHDITVHDQVLGHVTIKREQLEDFIIFKGEAGGGGPTFHFANVVDDATMGVTHVLRAQEHLMNTPKHLALFEAFGIQPPVYAHMPLIFNPDASKMSKRDKAKAARQAATLKMKNAGWRMEQLIEEIYKHSELIRHLVNPPSDELPDSKIVEFMAKKNDDPHICWLIAHFFDIALPEIDVHDFRVSGYLSDVLLNYLALLGWSPQGKDESGGERFDKHYVAQHFHIEGIGKSNAKFDRAKLLAFNAERLQKMGADEFANLLKEFIPQSGDGIFLTLKHGPQRWSWFAQAYQPRARTLAEPYQAGRFLVEEDKDIVLDPKAVEKVLKKNDRAGLKALRELVPVLQAIEPWEPAAIHRAVEGFTTAKGLGMGDVAQPIRVAVSGGTVSPPIDLTLAILGKSSTLNRIETCLRHLGGNLG